MSEVIRKRAEFLREIEGRHPMVRVIYNCLIVLVCVALIVSLCVWHVQVKAQKNAELMALREAEEYRREQEVLEAERQAAIREEQRLFAEQKEADTILMAKLLVGIDGFVENYGYSEGDLRTYGECVINRTLDKKNGFPNTLSEVMLQDSQWVGFSESNQVIEKYYKIAKMLIEDFYNNSTRPCSSDYCWAELRRDGVYLKKEFSDSPYTRTWRY